MKDHRSEIMAILRKENKKLRNSTTQLRKKMHKKKRPAAKRNPTVAQEVEVAAEHVPNKAAAKPPVPSEIIAYLQEHRKPTKPKKKKNDPDEAREGTEVSLPEPTRVTKVRITGAAPSKEPQEQAAAASKAKKSRSFLFVRRTGSSYGVQLFPSSIELMKQTLKNRSQKKETPPCYGVISFPEDAVEEGYAMMKPAEGDEDFSLGESRHNDRYGVGLFPASSAVPSNTESPAPVVTDDGSVKMEQRYNHRGMLVNVPVHTPRPSPPRPVIAITTAAATATAAAAATTVTAEATEANQQTEASADEPELPEEIEKKIALKIADEMAKGEVPTDASPDFKNTTQPEELAQKIADEIAEELKAKEGTPPVTPPPTLPKSSSSLGREKECQIEIRENDRYGVLVFPAATSEEATPAKPAENEVASEEQDIREPPSPTSVRELLQSKESSSVSVEKQETTKNVQQSPPSPTCVREQATAVAVGKEVAAHGDYPGDDDMTAFSCVSWYLGCGGEMDSA